MILIKRYIPNLSNFLAKHKELSDSIYTNLRRAVFVVITIHIISLENMNNSKYIVVIFCFFLICDYFMLTRKYKISKELFNEFKYIDKTYKENELYLTGYRKEVHEKKNQLLAIKVQVPKSYKDINAYIDTIIGKSSTRRKLFLDLNYICLPAAENLLDFKIGEMVQEKLSINLYVSPEISYAKKDLLSVKDKSDLCTMMGIFLDNAKEAAVKSEERFVSIEIYRSNELINFVVANTFDGEVDLDKINDLGYSTKGTNSGMGLNIVKDILKTNPIYSTNTNIVENYFVQTLKIDINQKK